MASLKKSINIHQIKKNTNCGNIHHFHTINSTNSWLLEHGECGDICISDKQSFGRGRRGNIWESPEGNIYFSLFWCFDKIYPHWSLLGLVTGTAIAQALKDTGLTNHGVKWPNDIFWQQKKLGGVLLESHTQTGEVVIGIGLNITPLPCSSEIEQPVTNLTEAMDVTHIKKIPSRELILISIINRLQSSLKSFSSLDYDAFIDTWNTWDILQSKAVQFHHQGSEVSGTVKTIDKHGRLGILKHSGELCFYSSADIKLTKSWRDG